MPGLLDLGPPVISSGPWLPPGAGDRPTHNGADIMYRRATRGDPRPPTFSAAFQCPPDTPCLAAANGIVRRVQDTRRGTVVEIGHPIQSEAKFQAANERAKKEAKAPFIPRALLEISAPISWITFSRHLERGRLLPKVGQTVRAGDVVGIVGADPSQGAAGLRHLHWEVQAPWPAGEAPSGEPGQPRSDNVWADPEVLLASASVLTANVKAEDLGSLMRSRAAADAFSSVLRAGAGGVIPDESFREALKNAIIKAARKLRRLRDVLPSAPSGLGTLLLVILVAWGLSRE